MTSTTPSFGRLDFEAFRVLAKNDAMTSAEKIGFPPSYRTGFEDAILRDIVTKLSLDKPNQLVLDIGCGCDLLADHVIDFCQTHSHQLLLVDSEEMLGQLNIAGKAWIKAIPGRFPQDQQMLEMYRNSLDAIIVYSVMQHVIMDSNPFTFVDKAVSLLKEGGRLLLGDIPNISKRKRFFSSNAGIAFIRTSLNRKRYPQCRI